MKGICVRSEINPLKKVLLHRPGKELLHLTPDRLPELLFDDIPFLKVAQQEHDAFAQILRDNGTEVVYLEDLMTDVLNLHPELVEPFLYQWLFEGNIKTKRWQDKLYDYLINNFKLASELGGEVLQIHSNHPIEAIIDTCVKQKSVRCASANRNLRYFRYSIRPSRSNG